MAGLVRVVRLGGGALALGRGRPGRGAWLCRDSPACIDLAQRRRAFDRALRGPVDHRDGGPIRVALRSGPAGVAGEGSESPVL